MERHTYEEVLNYAANLMQELSLEEQVQLLNDLLEAISKSTGKPPKKYDIEEFLGAEKIETLDDPKKES